MSRRKFLNIFQLLGGFRQIQKLILMINQKLADQKVRKQVEGFGVNFNDAPFVPFSFVGTSDTDYRWL